MEISERLTEARLLRKIKQKDLAKEIGISQTSLSLIENGVKFPHYKTLMKILKATKHSIVIIPNEYFKQ